MPAPRTSIPLPRVRLPWMRLPLSSGTGALVGPRRRRGVNSTLSWEAAAIRMTATDPGGGERLHRCQISEGAASWVRVLLVASGWMPRVDGLWRSLVAHLTGGQGVVGSNPASPTKYKHPHRRRCGFLFANTLLQQGCFVSPAISASISVTSVTPITTMEYIYSYFSFWNLLPSWLRSSKRCNDGTYPTPQPYVPTFC